MPTAFPTNRSQRPKRLAVRDSVAAALVLVLVAACNPCARIRQSYTQDLRADLAQVGTGTRARPGGGLHLAFYFHRQRFNEIAGRRVRALRPVEATGELVLREEYFGTEGVAVVTIQAAPRDVRLDGRAGTSLVSTVTVTIQFDGIRNERSQILEMEAESRLDLGFDSVDADSITLTGANIGRTSIDLEGAARLPESWPETFRAELGQLMTTLVGRSLRNMRGDVDILSVRASTSEPVGDRSAHTPTRAFISFDNDVTVAPDEDEIAVNDETLGVWTGLGVTTNFRPETPTSLAPTQIPRTVAEAAPGGRVVWLAPGVPLAALRLEVTRLDREYRVDRVGQTTEGGRYVPLARSVSLREDGAYATFALLCFEHRPCEEIETEVHATWEQIASAVSAENDARETRAPTLRELIVEALARTLPGRAPRDAQSPELAFELIASDSDEPGNWLVWR